MPCHRPMQRAAFALLLACASTAALAQNGHNASADGSGACPQDADATAGTDKPGPAKAAATRGKYAKPATPAARSDGGSSDGDNLPRPHAGKWHSFLPGMFR
ncbi:hypothetical protein GCM10027084_02460 [Pseudoxanthomonas sangjuensis]